jgi:hypothetical protein
MGFEKQDIGILKNMQFFNPQSNRKKNLEGSGYIDIIFLKMGGTNKASIRMTADVQLMCANFFMYRKGMNLFMMMKGSPGCKCNGKNQ